MDSQKETVLSGWEGEDSRKESISINAFLKIFHTTQWKVFLIWFVGFSERAKAALTGVLWCLVPLVSCGLQWRNEWELLWGSAVPGVQSPLSMCSFRGLLLAYCTHWCPLVPLHAALWARECRQVQHRLTSSAPQPAQAIPSSKGRSCKFQGQNVKFLWLMHSSYKLGSSYLITGWAVNSNH